MQLLYIANARFPTEKAHGYQIAQMCQAFIENGIETTLFRPLRENTSELKNVKDVSAYYNLRKKITVKTIWTLDLIRFVTVRYPVFRRFSTFVAVFKTLLFAINLGIYFRIHHKKYKGSVLFLRDMNLFSWLYPFLPQDLRKCVLEIHALSASKHRAKRQARILQQAKLIISVTGHLKKKLVELGVPGEKIMVEPDAVDLESFTIVESKTEARKKLGIPEDRRIASFIGKYHTRGDEKGIPEIILASKTVFQKHPDLYFYFVGGPLDRVPVYQELITKNALPEKQFVFIDKRPVGEVPYYLKSSDILLMPHPYSEFYAYYVSPLKLFEYMSAKKPIIASSLPSIEEILEDRKNALLGKAGDPSSIARNICEVLEHPDLSRKISTAAFNAVQHQTWIKRAERIMERIRNEA